MTDASSRPLSGSSSRAGESTVLVTYASAKGSTRGIAGRIAAKLESAHIETDLRSAAEESHLGDYDVLVIGSAIHNGQWLETASDIAGRAGEFAEDAQIWAFSVSSVGATSTTLAPRLAKFLRPRTPEPRAVQELRKGAEVRSHRWFAGTIAPGDWPGVGRVVFRLMGGHYGDARDWSDIENWADQIGSAIRQRRG